MDKLNFAQTLKEILDEKGLRQADLCRATDIPTSLMSDYISGKKSPTIRNAIAMADALHISLDILVGKTSLPANSRLDHFIDMETEQLCEKDKLFILEVIRALKKRNT